MASRVRWPMSHMAVKEVHTATVSIEKDPENSGSSLSG
jgi:hypothetical protein